MRVEYGNVTCTIYPATGREEAQVARLVAAIRSLAPSA
jgi:hypothetical protein